MTESAIAVVDVDEDGLDLVPLPNAEDEDQKPKNKKWGPDAPLWRTFATRTEILEYAADLGADMRMGLYVDMNGRRWNPHRPVIAEIMKRLGYGRDYTQSSRRPAWWPDRGMQAFLDYVELKVQLRRESGMMRFESIRPFMESLVGLSVVELTRRLRMNPGSISVRDLTDVLSKTTNVLTHGQGALPVNPETGVPKSTEGKDVYLTIINQATASMPEGVARDQLMGLFREHMEQARETIAIPASVARLAARENPSKKQVARGA